MVVHTSPSYKINYENLGRFFDAQREAKGTDCSARAVVLEAWDRLYEENKDKLAMPREENYPLDREALAEWAAAQRPGSAERGYASELAAKLRYVSWKEFRDALERCIDEVLSSSARFPPPFCFVVSGDEYGSRVPIGKSQAWVSLLAYGMLKRRGKEKLVRAVATDFDELIQWADAWVENGERVRNPCTALVFDDASYSGQQLARASNFLFSREKAHSRGVQRFEVMHVAFVVPFMTDTARKRLEDSAAQQWTVLRRADSANMLIPRAVFLDSTATIPSAVYDGKEVGLIYFDHKMADNISVGTFGLAVPAAFQCGRDGADSACSRAVPFIRGCEETHTLAATYWSRGSDSHIPRCPPPYYKSIEWTYGGKRMHHQTILSSLAALRVGHIYSCAKCAKLFSSGWVCRHEGSEKADSYCSEKCASAHCPRHKR